MTPEQRYQRDLATGDVFPDAAQAQVVGHTQRIYEDLCRDGQGRGSLVRELWGRFGGRYAALQHSSTNHAACGRVLQKSII